MKKISNFLPLILLLLLACNPQKRINRILNRNPELKRDTVLVIRDTLITKAFTFDTIYNYKTTHDTVFFKKENVQVKIFHHNDTIFFKADAKADTIYKKITVPYRQIIYTKDDSKRWLFFFIGISSILILIVLINIVLKWIKS